MRTKKLSICFYYAKNSGFHHEYIPVSFGYLKSYLAKQFPDSLDFIISDNIEEIINQDIDILAISSVTDAFTDAIYAANSLKKKSDRLVILGGSHITGLPMSLPENVDVGVIGEGEITFAEVVGTFLKNNGMLGTDNLSKIPGIVFWNRGKRVMTKPRPFIHNLDEIPIPDRSYYKKFNAIPYLICSRGCAYDCKFCLSSQIWGYRYRCFSPEYTFEEIKHLIEEFPELLTREIYFADDLFLATPGKIKKLINLLRENNLLGKLCFGCNIRAETVNERLCEYFKEMNIYRVNFGFESGSEKVLKYLKGNSASVKHNQRALDLLYKHGIVVKCSFIVGSPGEEENDLIETFELIIKNYQAGKILEPLYSIMTPYPGSAIWDYGVKTGKIHNNLNWSSISNYIWYRGDFMSGNCVDFADWVKKRKANQTVYVGDIPEDRLFEIMFKYETKIDEIKKTSPPFPTVSKVYGFRFNNKEYITRDDACIDKVNALQ